MKDTRTRLLGIAACAVLLALAVAGAAPPDASKDPLAAEIAKWETYLKTNDSKDEDWVQIKQSAAPILEKARQALHDDRRLLALQRLGQASVSLEGAHYVLGLPAARQKDAAAFEAEWRRVGAQLDKPTSADAFRGVQPAAVRAMAEAAQPQAKVFYDASLEYGRNTMAKYGLFYIGAAEAAQNFAETCRRLSSPTKLSPPPLRSLSGDLQRFDTAFLAAYRPPAAIDRHDKFIAASSVLKEARELEAAGLRYGAMLRYLQAVLRAAAAMPPGPSLPAAEVSSRLAEFQKRLDSGGIDHSIGRLFLETAQADLEATEKSKTPEIAAAVAGDVLPRYFAALEPAPPEPARAAPQVTVTLVRWPYTCNLSDPASMLAESVVADFQGKARFVSENYGDSKLARQYGVTRYPAVFVDDILVATPNDFGFYGNGAVQSGGRYAPLKSAAAHDRLRADLTKMVELILAGNKDGARAQAAPAMTTGAASLPAVTITDLDGKKVSRDDLAGRVVVVELWATWCPPCRSTLAWLADLKKKHGDRLVVVALAVESEEGNVRKVTQELAAPVIWAMGTPEVVRAFGDVNGVPTLYLFDKDGRAAATFFGATPTLHRETETKLAALLK